MKKLLLVIIIIAIALFGYSKFGEWQAFNKAYESNTIEAYEDFLSNFPKTQYRAEIEAWIETSKSNRSEDYLSFANTFPSSRVSKRALSLAGDLDWNITQKENTFASYEDFITKYPQHPKAEEAKQQLSQLRQQQIQEVRKAFAELRNIDGAILDEETGSLVLFNENKEEDNPLSPVDLDDLIMAMRVVGRFEDPGVSIEPPSTSTLSYLQNLIGGSKVPEYQTVRYIPEDIKGTHLGLQLFEADRMLKALSFGEDPITHQSVSSSVSGFQKLTYLARKEQGTATGYYGRIWFKPKEVVVKEAGNAIEIDRVVMGVESESKYPTPSEFAQFFEEHYQEIAKEKPIYKELIRIAKYVAVARWLNDNGYLDNLDLSDYQVKTVNTPSQTSTIEGLVKEQRKGDYIEQRYLIGGVILDTRNTYNRGENIYIKNMPLSSFAKEIVKSKPNKKATGWNFQVNNSKYKAITIPLKRR